MNLKNTKGFSWITTLLDITFNLINSTEYFWVGLVKILFNEFFSLLFPLLSNYLASKKKKSMLNYYIYYIVCSQ